jgi:hypothetical protein
VGRKVVYCLPAHLWIERATSVARLGNRLGPNLFSIRIFFGMHLLYIDESGGDDPGAKDNHFVLAGISAFERKPYYLSADVDAIQQKFFPGVTDPVEFRASAIWNGNGAPWDSMPRQQRKDLMRDIYGLLAAQRNVPGVSLFGIALYKADNRATTPIQRTCEEMAGLPRLIGGRVI